MEMAVAEGRAPAGGDHRMSAGKKDSKNPGAQMQRQQVRERDRERDREIYIHMYVDI